MKIIKINKLLLASLIAVAVFTGCEKDDGPISEAYTITAVPTISTPIDPTGSQAIDLLNKAAFAGKFKVEQYFPGTTPPTKIDVVVRKNASNTNVKVFKAGVTSLPAAYTVTAAEIEALFGATIALGDRYDFAPDIYVGERKFEAFPATGTGIGTGHAGHPLFSEFARFSAICAYNPDIYQGDFVVVSDAFGDFVPGEIVTLTKINNTQFSFIDPYVTNPKPIIVTINTLNNQATVTKQKIGDAFVWNLGYTNPNLTVSASTSSFVAPCSKELRLNNVFSVDQGTFNPYLLVLRKP